MLKGWNLQDDFPPSIAQELFILFAFLGFKDCVALAFALYLFNPFGIFHLKPLTRRVKDLKSGINNGVTSTNNHLLDFFNWSLAFIEPVDGELKVIVFENYPFLSRFQIHVRVLDRAIVLERAGLV